MPGRQYRKGSMRYERTAEGYAKYLESDHWDRLRTCVLERDCHRCVRCGSTERLQAHHKFYRDDWEQALVSDCETLFRPCHEKEHGISVTTVTVTVSTSETTVLNERKAIERARSQKQISRSQFLELRQKLIDSGMWRGRKQKKRKRSSPRRKPVKRKHRQFCTPWHYSPRRTHWVNRGTSSN